MSLDPTYLCLLACPQCKGPLKESPESQGLTCLDCVLEFPVLEGVPVLLMGEAKEGSKKP